MIQFKEGDRYELLVEVVTKAGGKLTVGMRPDISRARGALRAIEPTPAAIAADAWLVSLAWYTGTKAGIPTNQSNEPVCWPHEK